MAQRSITLTVHVARWVRPYINTCSIFASLFGMTPDVDRIIATIMRGVKVRTAS